MCVSKSFQIQFFLLRVSRCLRARQSVGFQGLKVNPTLHGDFPKLGVQYLGVYIGVPRFGNLPHRGVSKLWLPPLIDMSYSVNS